MQSAPITSNVVSSSLVHGEVYSIQHYMAKFVSDLRQVVGFLRVSTINQIKPKLKLTFKLSASEHCLRHKYQISLANRNHSPLLPFGDAIVS